MDTYFLKSEDILKFYDAIAQEYELYVPVRIKSPLRTQCEHGFSLPTDEYLLKQYSETEKEAVVFNEYRPLEPARAFFASFKESVCDFFSESEPPKKTAKPLALCGVKNCDLFALKIQDFVFLGGADVDPEYQHKRETTLVISGDCPSFKEVCFCRAFDIDPYAISGFDFNLSPLSGGYLVDVDSERAQKIAGLLKGALSPASFAQLSARAAKRESVVRKLEEHLQPHKIPKKDTLKDIVLSGYDSPIWNEQMRTCVECGGCVFMCDTCHCFLLSDEMVEKQGKRLRVWDGCLFKNFMKVAGGANPLKQRSMRLRNRYLKKFDFFVDNIGYQACCGCGRCIEVCPGKIDIRFILRKLYEEKYLPAR